MTPDPIPFLDRYPYVWNNPVNATDPYGLFCIGPKCVCDKVEDVLKKPINDVKDTVDYIDTMINHPSGAIQETAGFLVARYSLGNRNEVDGAIFYENCWGACTIFRAVPEASNITVGHFVFSQREPGYTIIQHELVHVRQGDENGWLWFYKYSREHFAQGYECNRFEEEARQIAGEESQCKEKE